METSIDSPERRRPPERRRWPRRRMLKHVQILSLDKTAASALDLTLRNISACGAQLFGRDDTLGRLPDEFYLVPPGQLRMVRCKVVWKTHNTAGVRFLSDLGALVPGQTGRDAAESGDIGEREFGQRGLPCETYVLDRTTGAVVRRDHSLVQIHAHEW